MPERVILFISERFRPFSVLKSIKENALPMIIHTRSFENSIGMKMTKTILCNTEMNLSFITSR